MVPIAYAAPLVRVLRTRVKGHVIVVVVLVVVVTHIGVVVDAVVVV